MHQEVLVNQYLLEDLLVLVLLSHLYLPIVNVKTHRLIIHQVFKYLPLFLLVQVIQEVQ